MMSRGDDTSAVRSVGLEICVDSVGSAIAAAEGGATRLELCANLYAGGTTPSVGLLTVVRRLISACDVGAIGIPVHAMVRPRGGDFLYSHEELEVMFAEIEAFKGAGAAGIVLGVLTADGEVDEPLLARLVNAAAPLDVTFHRAIDVSRDLPLALEACVRCGVSRILTSGGAPSAPEGLPMLRRLVTIAAGRLTIAAGGGLNEANAAAIAAQSGAPELHGSLRGARDSLMRHRPAVPIYMGAEKLNSPVAEFETREVRRERVTAVVDALRQVRSVV